MKFCKFTLFSLLIAFCLPAVAQTAMRVDIPFDFIAAGKSLPAGHYRIQRVQHMDASNWLITNDHVGTFMLTDPIESLGKAHRPSVVFLRADGEYSLIQIWTEEHSGRDVPRSKVKQTLVSEGAKEGAKYIEIGAE
jgi:hypothetical protein